MHDGVTACIGGGVRGIASGGGSKDGVGRIGARMHSKEGTAGVDRAGGPAMCGEKL